MSRLILASASPRRLALLSQVGIVPDGVVPADVDEAPSARELPRPHVKRLAEAKARAVAVAHADAYVIGADTVVAVGRRILGKATDEAAALRYLKLLSGRRHRVFGGICVAAPDGRAVTRVVETAVIFKTLSDDEIAAYIAGGEWRDKAGAYGIQGAAGAFVRRINGSYPNVVGLALVETVNMLRGLGWRAPS